MYISLTNPFNLIFLFAIPLMIFFHFFGLKTIRGKALKFANFEAIAKVKGIDLYSKNITLLIFDIIFICLLVFSISGLTLHKEVKASSFSFVIAIDTSESMSATDMDPNRIDVAKQTAVNFVESSPYDSPMGIISFSGNSYIEQELSNNKQEIKAAINRIELSEVKGTDIYEAVSLSVNLLNDEKSKAIILLSDGQINTGEVNKVIEYAKEENVLIHTFAIGTLEGGESSFGISKLDEETLNSLSYSTGGKFFNVKSKVEMQDGFGEILQVTRKLGSIDLSYSLIILSIIFFISKQFLISINKVLW